MMGKGETKIFLTLDYTLDSRSRPKLTNKHQHIQAINVYWTGGKVKMSWGNADFLLLRKKWNWAMVRDAVIYVLAEFVR